MLVCILLTPAVYITFSHLVSSFLIVVVYSLFTSLFTCSMEPEDNKQTPSIAEDAFEALEKDFQDVLQELMGDKSLEKFRLEYEKLHQALRQSHESEKKLVMKCRCVLFLATVGWV